LFASIARNVTPLPGADSPTPSFTRDQQDIEFLDPITPYLDLANSSISISRDSMHSSALSQSLSHSVVSDVVKTEIIASVVSTSLENNEKVDVKEKEAEGQMELMIQSSMYDFASSFHESVVGEISVHQAADVDTMLGHLNGDQKVGNVEGKEVNVEDETEIDVDRRSEVSLSDDQDGWEKVANGQVE
ncbi:hypothetical protein HDU76_010440, partial [Blyttiomyces sp. JEL0837]